MEFRLSKWIAVLLVCVFCMSAEMVFMPTAADAQLLRPIAGREGIIVDDSRRVLEEIMEIPANSIPEWLFEKAEAVAIFPGLMKGSFIVGAQHGKGVLIVKNKEAKWEAPRFVKLTGGSVGFQAGIQSADIILVFCTQRSVESALRGQFTIGADASVAAGPIGRQASASTDARLGSEIYSYSRSRGIFLGVALDGCAMEVDNEISNQYYRNGVPENAAALVHLVAGYVQNDDAPASVPTVGDAAGNTSGNTSVPTVPTVDEPLKNDRETLRQQLVLAHSSLMQLLQPEWQTWLALPPGVMTAAGKENDAAEPSFPELLTLQERFHRLNDEPKYAELAEKPEFQQVLLLLDQYLY